MLPFVNILQFMLRLHQLMDGNLSASHTILNRKDRIPRDLYKLSQERLMRASLRNDLWPIIVLPNEEVRYDERHLTWNLKGVL